MHLCHYPLRPVLSALILYAFAFLLPSWGLGTRMHHLPTSYWLWWIIPLASKLHDWACIQGSRFKSSHLLPITLLQLLLSFGSRKVTWHIVHSIGLSVTEGSTPLAAGTGLLPWHDRA